MKTRVFVVAVVCAFSAGLAAQQAQPQAQGNDGQYDRTKSEVRTFEMVLIQSIESAGQKLAAWAGKLVPNVILSPAADPVVNGVPLPDSSVVFMIRISELSGVTVFTRYPGFVQTPPVGGVPDSPARPVSQTPPLNDAKVSSTNVVADDPMKNNNAPNPNAMYSDFVRLGLMDAMLDGSTVLTLKEGQWLTVVVVPVDVLVTNSLYRNTSRKLVLSIKADDLNAFRQGKITRDEAKQRIVDTRF